MVSVLCRSFGFEKIDLVEDAVQDALISAMKTWPFSGQPDNPKAWLLRAARNRCIDLLRRDNKLDRISDSDFDLPADEEPEIYFTNEVSEDQLQMIFACCHPAIPPDSQVALTLKTVCGFGVDEIARAYLSNREAVTRMLTRAKTKLRQLGVRLEMPEPSELPDRVDAVVRALYLMFNEGYSASAGDELIRRDLVFEAIRLAESLAAHPVTASPTVDAVAALFLFQGSRMSSRSDHNGELLILGEQDRSTWDAQLISRGIHHFRLSAHGDVRSVYHIESEIAALYTLAPDYASTDWHRILACYETLQKRNFSPIIELNRIIVLGEIHGPQAAAEQLRNIENHRELMSYNLFFITKAHYCKQLGTH